MRSALTIILLVVAAIVYQSCDSTLNIDKPKDFYKYIGGDGDQTGVDMVLDADGNAYILGSTNSDSLGLQLYVVMANTLGEVGWSKTYGDKGDETPKDIEMLDDGSLVVLADRPDGKFVVYRLSKGDGTELTTAMISADHVGYADHAISITQISDGFIVAGYSDNGSFKVGMTRRYKNDMTEAPDAEWTFSLSQLQDADGHNVVPVKVIQRDANGFFIFGYTDTPGDDLNPDYNYFFAATSALNDNVNGIIIINSPDSAVFTDERLVSVKQAPVQSGGGFILTGYTSSGSSQDLYIVRIVQDPTNIRASYQAIQGTPRVITSGLANLSGSFASVYPSNTSGFYILGNEGVSGDNNLYLTKLNNDLSDAWGDDQPARTLGGVGDDAGGAVAETPDGRVLVVGTMVLGDLKGQRKIVLMNLDANGMFGN